MLAEDRDEDIADWGRDYSLLVWNFVITSNE